MSNRFTITAAVRPFGTNLTFDIITRDDRIEVYSDMDLWDLIDEVPLVRERILKEVADHE